jgi:hypothetical protein
MILRFGIMCNGTTLAAWEAACVRRLLAVDGVEAGALIVEKPPPRPAVHRPLLKKAKTLLTSRKKLWLLYERLFVEGRIPALESVEMPLALADLPRLECETVRQGKFSEYFGDEDLARIRALKLDFILRFAFGIIRGAILTVPRYGVWSFHHDDEEKYRGGPPGFWEIYHRDPWTGSMLQRLTDRLDGGIVLRKERFPTVGRSFVRNRDACLNGCTSWPADVCREILGGDDSRLFAPPSRSSAPVYQSPNDWQMLRFVSRIALNRLRPRP